MSDRVETIPTPKVEDVDCRLVIPTTTVEVASRRCLPEESVAESLPVVLTPSIRTVVVVVTVEVAPIVKHFTVGDILCFVDGVTTHILDGGNSSRYCHE